MNTKKFYINKNEFCDVKKILNSDKYLDKKPIFYERKGFN